MKDSTIWLVMLTVCVLCFCFLSGCANRQLWKKTIIEDHINKITTTTLVYESDNSFSLGTKGIGHYQVFSVNGVGK